MLFLNGIPASDVGVIVEHRPPRPIPRRRTLSWEVPGRSGRLVRQLDERDNVSLSYDLARPGPISERHGGRRRGMAAAGRLDGAL